MGVGYSQAQRIGCIGSWQTGQLQQTLHHGLHLGFVCASISHYGLFHL